MVNFACEYQQNSLTSGANNILFSESDRIFGGSRDVMILLERFIDFAETFYTNKTRYYYPLNIGAITSSDWNAHCWSAYNFDRRLWLIESESSIPYKLMSYNLSSQCHEALVGDLDVPPSSEDIYSFHGGCNIFPAERSFSHYLTSMGIKLKSHQAFNGRISRNTFRILGLLAFSCASYVLS